MKCSGSAVTISAAVGNLHLLSFRMVI